MEPETTWITEFPWRSTLEILAMIGTILTPIIVWQGFRLERRKAARKDIVFDVEHVMPERERQDVGMLRIKATNTEPISAVVLDVAITSGSIFSEDEATEIDACGGLTVSSEFDPSKRQRALTLNKTISRSDHTGPFANSYIILYVPAESLSDNSLQISFTWRWSDERRFRKTRRYLK